MNQILAFAAGHVEVVLYAFSLIFGALPNALLLLQRRGFGRGGFGGFRPRRRRRGGIFGTLALFFLLGPIIIIGLIAYALYGLFSQARRGR